MAGSYHEEAQRSQEELLCKAKAFRKLHLWVVNHVKHDFACAKRVAFGMGARDHYRCTCGLDEALKELP